jgi:hypothetical protein
MSSAYSTHGESEKCIQGSVGKLERTYYLGDPDIDMRIILKWILNN